MESRGKKGTFVRYSEASKEFQIYVLGERHVDVFRYVTFHEEETFKLSKDLECDPNPEDFEATILEDHDDESFPSNV